MILIDTYQVTACLSGASLLLAIASPIITSFLNHRYEQKMKHIEWSTLHQAEVIEQYLTATGAVIQSATNEIELTYGSASAEIYLAVSEDLWPLIDEIDQKIKDKSYAEANAYLHKLCKELALSHNPRKKI